LGQALRARGLHYGAPIFLRIFKASKELELWVQGRERFRLFRIYTICAASGELGPKKQEGDLQSPEGFYVVTPCQDQASTPGFYPQATLCLYPTVTSG
jgi:murein L,D-transpeptidase YafK